MDRRSKTSWKAAWTAAAALVAAAAIWPTVGGADEIDDQYLERSRSLANDDVPGHLELAKWCKEHERWNLVADECNLVLRLEPNNTQAQLLRDIARTYLKKQQRKGGDEAGSTGDAVRKPPRLLTDDEIQQIRRAELRRDGQERARIRIDRRAMVEFFDEMETMGKIPHDRSTFFGLPLIDKALLMLDHGGEKYAKEVTVVTDPERLRIFARDVAPILANGCASVECHGGSGPTKFQLYGGRRLRENALYTNFYILHEYTVGEQRLINRNYFKDSLILTYGLPPQPGSTDLNHPTPIRPIFTGPDDREYRTVHDWLATLTIDRPNYGIDLKIQPAP